jgi:iron complex outermembrane receptor protein
MKQTILMAFGFILMPTFVFSQITISGKITNKNTNESLVGAHIIVKETSFATVSNGDGFYKIKSLKTGNYTLEISYIGYKTISKKINFTKASTCNFEMEVNTYMTDEVLIVATKVPENSPTTFKNLDKEKIKNTNLGQDLPFLLEMMPSTITSSDAGAGIGYTGIRIRGTDITRINVSINGIPLNDPESHAVYWVNMPDFASSIDNIQVQRGVGTSTNGAAAFGASINLQTTTFNTKPYAEINSSFGSFNTFKNNIRFGTGLLNGKFTIDGRLSKITSEGYIDRAFSNLKSFFISAGFYGKNNIVKLNIFSGKEKTYQAWYGISKNKLKTNRTFNPYTYKNQTDNYQQNHYQLLFTQKISSILQFNAALHYTHGEGYYEELKKDEKLKTYKIPVVQGTSTISKMDLIRQKWLNNDFYGVTYSLKYEKSGLSAVLGGAWNKYKGDHFGEVIWSQYAVNIDKNHRWYFNKGSKRDFNIFTKVNYQLNNKINLYGDIQFRSIKFDIDGIHDDLRNITTAGKFNFINPKAGIFYTINNNSSAYASFAISNREPSRNSYRDADANNTPNSEHLIDYEIGYSLINSIFTIELNGFFMDYTDQLVNTGKINNVGSPIMMNVADSYRLGLEFSGGIQIAPKLRWEFNATLSKNKIKDFTTYIDNWDTGIQLKEKFGKTTLSFSPSFIGGSTIKFAPTKGLNFSFISKYVSRQYVDNTTNIERSLDPYFVNNINASYTFKTNLFPEISFRLLVNNVFDEKYETNAWVYRYSSKGKLSADFGYFPQAGINFLLGVSLKF